MRCFPALPAGWCRRAVATLLATAVVAAAQVVPQPYDKHSQWFAYNGDHALTARWGLHFDGGFRQMDAASWQQWLVRPAVNFRPARAVQLSAGYAYFKSFPGGIGWDPASAPEHRLYQQVAAAHRGGPFQLRHRVRVEQRFLGSGLATAVERCWPLQHRLRYQAKAELPLVRNGGEQTLVYLSVYDEVLFRLGYAGTSRFDQNRAYGGLGYRPTRTEAVECGVISQRFQPMAGGRLEHNWILVVTVSSNSPVQRLLRRAR
ncbi:MAG: DUF2490 domain-containing protein [Bryobacterales bacterium]|nr:DUF2490 domain-containing protein [Bryobacterales bacterium]